MNWIILDIGSFKIKALQAQLEGNKVKLTQFLQWPSRPEFFSGLDFPTDQAWAQIGILLNEAGWLPQEGTAVTAALPSSYLETRYLRFPFKSEKKIEKVLPLELESNVPFEIDDLLLRHRVLKGPGIRAFKDALVLILGYKRDLIQKFEGHLKNFQTSIPPISAEILNLLALRSSLPANAGISGILWMGHRKTQLLLFQSSGTVLATKTFWWGGSDFVKKISGKFKVSEERAQDILEKSANFEAGPAIEIELAEALEDSLSGWIDEFRQFLKGLEQNGFDTKISFPIYVGGGPSQIQGILSRIQDRCQDEFPIAFREFPLEILVRQVSGLLQIEDPMAAIPALSQILAQTKNQRSKIPIFSESTFQFQQNIRRIKNQSADLIRKLALLLLFPISYLILSLMIQNQDVKKMRQELQEVLVENQLKIDASKPVSEVLSTVRKEAVDFRKKLDLLQEDRNSPLIALSQLSKSLPSRVRVDVKEFRATTEKVFVSLETNSISARDEILKSLQANFKNVKSGAPRACSSFEGCQLLSMEMERKTND